MRNNVYLNEENYKRINGKIKMAGTVVIMVALVIIGLGIIMKINASGIQVPAMGSDNWFAMETAKSSAEFKSTGLIMFGVWLTFLGCIIRFFIGNRREIMAYSVQSTMPIAQEGILTMAPTIGEAGATMMKSMAPAMGEVVKEMAPAYKEMAKEMAPVYAEVAKGVAQGIKEGLNE